MSNIQRQPTPHPNQIPDMTGKITYRLIKEYSRKSITPENTRNFYVIRVGQWTNQAHPTLEKRRIYICKKTGEERAYKMQGWDKDDMQLLADNWQEINQLLQGM